MKIDAATFRLSAPLAPITRLMSKANARTMSCMMPSLRIIRLMLTKVPTR